MSTFASPPRSLPRKRTPNLGEREYSARFIAAGPVPAHRPTMGAAGTMLSDLRSVRAFLCYIIRVLSPRRRALLGPDTTLNSA